jgi:hypothetical protein
MAARSEARTDVPPREVDAIGRGFQVPPRSSPRTPARGVSTTPKANHRTPLKVTEDNWGQQYLTERIEISHNLDRSVAMHASGPSPASCSWRQQRAATLEAVRVPQNLSSLQPGDWPPRWLAVLPGRVIRPGATAPTQSPLRLPGLHVFSPLDEIGLAFALGTRRDSMGSEWGLGRLRIGSTTADVSAIHWFAASRLRRRGQSRHPAVGSG